MQRITDKVVKLENLRTEIKHKDITFKLGELVKRPGHRGEYTIREIRDDGTVTVYGGTKNRKTWRTFTLENLYHV